MVNDISDEVEEVFLKDSVKSDKVEPLPHLTTTSQAPTPIPSPHQNSTSSSTLSPSSTITTTQAPITSTQPKATEAPTSTTSKPVIHALKPHEKPTKDEGMSIELIQTLKQKMQKGSWKFQITNFKFTFFWCYYTNESSYKLYAHCSHLYFSN